MKKGSQRSKRFYGVTLSQLVEAGALNPGEVFTFEWHGQVAKSKITGNGTMLVDDVELSTPTGAAKEAFPDIGAIAGWNAWIQEEGGKSLFDIRAEYMLAKDSKSANGDPPR